MCIRTSASTTPTALDPKQVVQQCTHKVIMEEAMTAAMSNQKGCYWETGEMIFASSISPFTAIIGNNVSENRNLGMLSQT